MVRGSGRQRKKKKSQKILIYPQLKVMKRKNYGGIRAGALKQHVYKLSQEIGDRSFYAYEKLMQAQEYIRKSFLSYGYKVLLDGYDIEGREFNNIAVTKKGEDRPDEIVILGAHYDSCSNPGADDNASGVAVLLELAKSFSGLNCRKTVKFIAFVNEEPPFFHTENMGSKV
ncbi:MAG: M28 family peptidase, partial [Candidatus Omnitrophica bacterium]|nr:M28 family peptidase [Candidatus Omnitrophota bacterium]